MLGKWVEDTYRAVIFPNDLSVYQSDEAFVYSGLWEIGLFDEFHDCVICLFVCST